MALVVAIHERSTSDFSFRRLWSWKSESNEGILGVYLFRSSKRRSSGMKKEGAFAFGFMCSTCDGGPGYAWNVGGIISVSV